MLELEPSRTELSPALQRHRPPVQANLGIQGPPGHAKTQWFQTQYTIVEDKVAGEIGER
ncbi:hypothetical protein D3C78_1112320 [compost metagenome]